LQLRSRFDCRLTAVVVGKRNREVFAAHGPVMDRYMQMQHVFRCGTGRGAS
jgi:hypothetical protein